MPFPERVLRAAPCLAGLCLTMLMLPAALAAAAPAAAASAPAAWPAVLGQTLQASIDDPQSALEPARRLAVTASADERFWRWLAVARLELTLEMDEAAGHSLQRARAALPALAGDEAVQGQRWLRAMTLRLTGLGGDAPAQLRPLTELRSQLPPGPSVLRCDLLESEAWVLNAIGSLDEAWRAAEALDACGSETGWPLFSAVAAMNQGLVAAGDRAHPQARERTLAHFARAERLVGTARHLRSLIAFGAAISLAELDLPAQAQAPMARALAISRELGDRAGIAAALVESAAIELDLGRPADALPPLAEAQALFERLGEGDAARIVRVHALELRAMTALQHPALAARLARAAAVDLSGELPQARRKLVLAMAEAQAALGRYEAAYANMQRARTLNDEARQIGRDAQVLMLRFRYDSARREAEIAALKHREETAQLTLQAQAATQRGLWAAVAALLAALAGGAVLGWHLWQRRRELADLALRDALTGLPNRRAIEAYARAQLDQARRLGLPYALALLDLDQFKAINDRHGHAVGDALLQALARVVPQVLRTPDRIGRWGGEEFLLVLPGTRGDELGGVFARLLSVYAVADVAGLPSPHGVSFSMGGAQAAADVGFDTLLSQADRQLYAAKAAGRATWR